ncbi:monoterpene epsilon-lactone hydrolase [Aspergillus udagawae]|nr:monoterpene epsilon-lactone hydrolase [Aspergillus udagawae]
MTTPELICANWDLTNTDCKKEGRYTCKNCYLILYCGPVCQKSHWTRHRSECKSPLNKKTWQPAWVLENRKPSFIGGGVGVQFGMRKYLWGNIPAFDVLRLGLNEGEGYGGVIRILFAASGDLRNIVKTIARLPNSYSQPLELTVNDRDFEIVARNVILLLIALIVEEVDEAVDCIIHFWYSAFVRESDVDVLRHRIRPLIEDVCNKIKDKKTESLLAKTWNFGRHSLRVVLERSSWDRLLAVVDPPAGLTADRAREVRAAITLAESRKDYRDRYMYYQSPSHRIAFNKFREDGLLLPFGSIRHEFREPNPTFFQSANTWPMNDNADPLHGWPLDEVVTTSTVPATADIYGKLFFYIRGMLGSFLGRLPSLKLSFQLFQLDAACLPDHLENNSFSRIEVSNISDAGWLGIHHTLRLMVPLLQTPLDNPHATLVTLFMNAVDETLTDEDRIQDLTAHSPTTKRLFKYLPPKGRPTSPYDPELIKFNLGRDLVKPYDHIFDRYSKNLKFREAADFFGAAMKETHTIIDKWPYRLKLRPGQPGAQEEFDRCISGGMSGKERYVEWKIVPMGTT